MATATEKVHRVGLAHPSDAQGVADHLALDATPPAREDSAAERWLDDGGNLGPAAAAK